MSSFCCVCVLTGRGVVILLCLCVDRERCGHLAVFVC